MNRSILIQGTIEFIEGGLAEEKQERFRLATTAYFKAMTQVCDLLLLGKIGKTSENHTERFRLLESNFPKVYFKVSSAFKVYRDTYSKPINKSMCEKIKNDVKEIIILGRIEEEFKETLQKI